MLSSIGTSRPAAAAGMVAPRPTTAQRAQPSRAPAPSRSTSAAPSCSSRKLAGSFGGVPPAASRRAAATVPAAGRKVALLGAAGGIGQPLALLLKLNPRINELRLYDIANVAGVAADLSHINTTAKVTGHTGAGEIASALSGADVVIIPAGVPRKPGMTRDDLFNINAGIVRTLIQAVAEHAPKAIINIISNPVNSTVPIAAETLKKAGVYDPKRVLGVTTLDVVRAQTFSAEKAGVPVSSVSVPVVGGHAGETILPLFSQATPKFDFDDETVAALTVRTQNAGTEVVEAKAGAGSATLSMAYAAAVFAESVLRALEGEKGVRVCTFTESSVQPGFDYFASEVILGTEGVEEFLPLGELSPSEAEGLKAMEALLSKNIAAGTAFATK